MTYQFSPTTVAEYMPALRRIFAALEVGFADDQNPELNDMRLHFLENELPGSTYVHAMDIITIWLEGTNFKADFSRIWRRDPESKVDWRELMDILRQKMAEYGYNVTIIEMVLYTTGRITRMIGGTEVPCDFKGDGLKVELLRLLMRSGDYVPTEEICGEIGCDGIKSLSDLKRTINHALRKDLRLPPMIDVIDSKSGEGYRIHPFYRILSLE